MDNFILISEAGIEREMWCKCCRAFTPHHINMIAYNSQKHLVSFNAFCLDCFEDMNIEDEITISMYIFTVAEWEEFLEIDPNSYDFSQN